MEQAEREERVEKTFCSQCGGERNCDILGHATDEWDEHGGAIWGHKDWYILRCRGCDHTFCQTVEVFSEDYSHEWDDQTQEDVLVYDKKIEYWPAISKRKVPDWFSSGVFAEDAEGQLYAIMTELYRALDNDLIRLSAAAVRTAFDIAAEILGVDAALNFREKLGELVRSSRINGVDRERLEALTEAGSASMHRGWLPSPEHLSTMVDILEHFIHRAFVQPSLDRKLTEQSTNLRRIVPARKPKGDRRPTTEQPAD